MHMFCFQCQETSGGRGCTFGGHCGKSEETANYQDLLIASLKALSLVSERCPEVPRAVDELIYECLFSTITNTNFDTDRFASWIGRVLEAKRELLSQVTDRQGLSELALWDATDPGAYASRAYRSGVLQTADPDVRSLRETITYGLKGLAAYAHHAAILGAELPEIGQFARRALARISDVTDLEQLFELALETGQANLRSMEVLDRENARVYGVPRPCRVKTGVGTRPGILISGHDLLDIAELLEQSEQAGVDIYTHGEMIAAHYYPKLARFSHLLANYGGSWWRQDVEFEAFRGPILMTTNCITPVQDSYRDRIWTTGVAGYPEIPHIDQHLPNGQKDFSALIERARSCPPPTPIDDVLIDGGYNHAPLLAMADEVLDLVRKGKLRRVVVIGGCDGRDQSRVYYREVAEQLPPDTVILTAGCAKYVFCKLPLGDIDGVPRVLDAGQCNDCYSLIHFARRLADKLGMSDINQLPISYQVCWYDQKAVAVYLTLLALGVRKIRLGPSYPAFFSPAILSKLEREYGLLPIRGSATDVAAMLNGD